jgi:hypothetical protein
LLGSWPCAHSAVAAKRDERRATETHHHHQP